jgi:hypothetical protein
VGKILRAMSGAVAVALTVGGAAIISDCGDDAPGRGGDVTSISTADGRGEAAAGGTKATGGAAGAGSPGGHGGGAPRPSTCAELRDTPRETIFWGVWISPTGEIWVAGADGWIGHGTRNRSGGGAWKFCQRAPGIALRAIWGASDTDVWAVGSGGTVLRWDGGDWSAVADIGAPAPGDLYDVWGSGATSVWIVGDGGLVRRFDGAAWHVEDADARYNLHGVWGAPAGVLRVVGTASLPPVFQINGAEAVVLRQSGATWTREAVFVEERGIADFRRLSGASDTDIWAVGTKLPSGAAASFPFAAHFDGTSWTPRAGSSVPGGPTEEQLVERSYSDVIAAPPNAPGGALIASPPDSTLFDGTTWTTSAPELIGLDRRGSAMWGTGGSGQILRWTGTAWVLDIGP